MNGFSTEDDSRGGHDQICCLLDDSVRCDRMAGNASYSKRIQRAGVQRKLKLAIDESAKHMYICEFHKSMIQSVRTKRKRKESDDDTGSNDQDIDVPEVDLYQLQVSTLRRYKRHYKVQTKQGLNKAQLADALMRHFKTIPVVDKDAQTFFIYMVKNNKGKSDLKSTADPLGM